MYDCRYDGLIREFELDDRVRGMTWSPAARRLFVRHVNGLFLSVIQDTFLSHIDDPRADAPAGPGAEAWRLPTLIRHALSLGGIQPALLLDICGRKVMDLQPGDNDIRHLAPGVFFVREEGPRIHGSEGSSVRKVVIQR